MTPHQDIGSSKCDLLPAGQFGMGASCSINTYSEEGSVECMGCASGKYSDMGASQCIECDFMYRLSTHCDVPYAGMLMILSALIVVAVASLLFRRYKKKQDRIKQKLRLDLYRQKQLVKTKQTDIKLMTGTYFSSYSSIFVSHSRTDTTTTGAWKLSPQEVKLEENIASGAYGEVWKGALHDRWIVAIKKLFPSTSSRPQGTAVSSRKSTSRSHGRSSSKAKRNMNKLFHDDEIRFLMRTRHERLVMFLGCGLSEDGGCFLVTEFMDGGSLDRALWAGGGHSSMSTSWTQRIQILLDVVDGLAYLHLMHKSVHQDLKSPNILLEKVVHNEDAARTDQSVTHRAKLADFGLTRIFIKKKKRIGETQETKKSSKDAIRAANWISMKRKGFVGTPQWMAPEMMKKEVKIGPSADIYSFGVVMWEVWSRRKPWSELSDKQEIFKAVRDDKRRLRVTNEREKIEGYEELIRSCTEYKANRRPLIDSVRSDLQALLERAAEVDSKVHLRDQDTVNKPLEMMEDDTKAITHNELYSIRDDSTEFQGGNSSSSSGGSSSPPVHIQMGTIEESCQ